MSDATRVAIIGLGAIGGSAALKLLSRDVAPIGFARDTDDRERAAAAGIGVADSIESAVKDVDLILLAVPLDQLAEVARRAMKAAPVSSTILHATSLQRRQATGFDEALSNRVVGTHPLAGTTKQGFAAADADRFRGATVYVQTITNARAREDAELFWSMAGASRIEHMDAERHDDLMAAMSHVPQLLATALAANLAYASIPSATLGPGARDMTRLADSSWSMWKPMLSVTPARTLILLQTIENELRQMRESLAAGDVDDVGLTWSVARDWRREIAAGAKGP